MVANGRVCQAKQAQQPSIVFATKDPNINLRLEKLGSLQENCLQVKLEIVRLPGVMAEDLEKKNGIRG